jgi:UDP-N-acetylglucosamine 2-epimerase (non-hydrolysing)
MIKKVMCVVGTRPEAIKMAPLILELQKNKNLKCIVTLTGQHTDMVYSVFKDFEIEADFDLNIQNNVRSVEDVLLLSIKGIKHILTTLNIDYILVHGDTSSTLAGAVAGMYCKIPVGHVEAGLRSYDIENPWPEEYHRKTVASLAEDHFAPTPKALKNLLDEKINLNNIIMTGNTVVDALQLALSKIEKLNLSSFFEKKFSSTISFDRKIILFTGHRRENLGLGLNTIFKALMEISLNPEVEVIFPLHPNPKVRESIANLLTDKHNIKIIDPLNYLEMIWVLSKIYLLITDSGGLQEEAANFDLPVLVTRLTTERMEAIEIGQAHLVGSDHKLIVGKAWSSLNKLRNVNVEKTKKSNPFGDGLASKRIVNYLERKLLYTKFENENFEDNKILI